MAGAEMDFLSNLLATIGAVVIGAGAVGAFAWWLFRLFSEKWLNAKFEESLAAYKHEQQKELEHLKFEINAQMDRATKLHQREFEALPEAWARLMHAYGIISSLVSRLQSTPDLNSMNPAQRDDFVQESKLAEWQREAVLGAKDKTQEYRNQVEPFKIARARKASQKFYMHFRSNGIFIREPIKEQFIKLDELMLAALSEHQMNFQHQTREFGSIDRLAAQGETMLKKLELEVQKRLWGSAVAEVGQAK
jgi:hypothetical protein